MADVSPSPAPGMPGQSLISITLVIYLLFGIAAVVPLLAHGFPLILPLFGVLGIVAVIIAYVKRSDAAGTWLASHYRWLIRTFWFSFLWGAIGVVIIALFWWLLGLGIVVGYAIWIATTIWVLYRLIRGYLAFKDSRPVPGM
ncbi:MAG TPA: hypothetical protein VFR50_07495 [Casimicrobiaceae bacterium]|jgi:uncharacterized membrane protein|nr:hypothetical protein [Casimicrobiaceae bacterium]